MNRNVDLVLFHHRAFGKSLLRLISSFTSSIYLLTPTGSVCADSKSGHRESGDSISLPVPNGKHNILRYGRLYVRHGDQHVCSTIQSSQYLHLGPGCRSVLQPIRQPSRAWCHQMEILFRIYWHINGHDLCHLLRKLLF